MGSDRTAWVLASVELNMRGFDIVEIHRIQEKWRVKIHKGFFTHNAAFDPDLVKAYELAIERFDNEPIPKEVTHDLRTGNAEEVDQEK